MKIEKVFNLIENMTILELNNLFNLIKEKYNFKDVLSKEEVTSKQDIVSKKPKTYKLNLISFGKNKISVIKLVKEIKNTGLKETKDIVESCPVVIKDDLDIDNLNILKEKFKNVGAEVTFLENE